MNIAIYCVNYHSYGCLNEYLRSVDRAAAQSKASVRVVVSDNTTEGTQPIPTNFAHIEVCTVSNSRNLGYFGAVRTGMLAIAPDSYDYVVISNVDLRMNENFFCQLENIKPDNTVGWMAPRIYSALEKRDRNPKILRRYTLKRLSLLRYFFRHPYIYWLYTHTLYHRKKLQSYSAGIDIYAGHGSFIILTKAYISQCGLIDYPVFLYCEEIYLAEKCREAALRVVYTPSLEVQDEEHASTGRIKRSRNCKYNADALSYIIKTFYSGHPA